MNQRDFSRGEIEPIAADLWRRCGAPRLPRGEKLGTIWKVAAAFSAGLLSEADVYDACRGTRLARRPGPRYFWTILKNRLAGRGKSLKEILAAVRITPSCPQGVPKASASGIRVACAPPADDRRAEIERRRAEMDAVMARLEAEEPP